jgi:hypothetical protein
VAKAKKSIICKIYSLMIVFKGWSKEKPISSWHEHQGISLEGPNARIVTGYETCSPQHNHDNNF